LTFALRMIKYHVNNKMKMLFGRTATSNTITPHPNKPINCEIFVAVCSCNRDSNVSLRDACRTTWLEKIPDNVKYKFFVGKGYDGDEDDVVEVKVGDTYWDLPRKMKAIYEWIHENCEYNYVYKCDDDTYAILDKLKELTVFGHDFIGNDFLLKDNKKYASGGAGYYLSKNLLPKIITEEVPERGLEDVTFSRLALKHTKNYTGSSRLYYNVDGFKDKDMISAHWLSAHDMVSAHYKLTGQGIEMIEVDHPYWSDTVELFKNGNFRRQSNGDSGKYTKSGNVINLQWNIWPHESFKTDGNKYIKIPE